MIRTKFYVRSDVDDNNIRSEFDNSVDAISYAAGFSPEDKCYVVEVTVDVDEESGEILRELDSETIWTFEDLPTEDAFGVEDWPDVSIKDEEEMKLDTDFDVKDIHEELEAREDLVECQHCFDLFPKEECTKLEYGYICPHCHSLVVKQVEFPSEMIDDATFGLEFPEPCKFDDDGDEDEIEGEYTEMTSEKPEFISTNEVSEEPIAIENPVEAAPEVSIETPVTFAEIPVTVEGSGLEDSSSDDSSDEINGILEEHVQDRPAPIEDTTELHGMDNAVVDCQTDMKVIAHSEDEKPLDCLMKKPALEEPLAGKKLNENLNEENKVLTKFVQDKMAAGEDIETITNSDEFKELVKEEGKKDLGITEGFDDELVAFAASLPEDLNEEVLDEGIFGVITAKDIDKKFNSDGYIVIGRNKDGSEKERKSFNHFKDAEVYAQNFSKLSDNGTGAVIAIDHGKNTALKAFDNGKEVLNTIKDIFKEIKKDDKEAKSDAKAMKKMAKADEKSTEENHLAEPKPEERSTEDALKSREPKAEEEPIEEPKSEEAPKVEEKPAEETLATKRDMSKQNEARAEYKKIEDALKILGVDTSILRDGKKVTQKFKDLRKALFTESYPNMPFDSDTKEGDKIRIIHLEGEDNSYDGKEGTVERIDGIGQLHGTWGGLAVIPGVDQFEVITNEELIEAKKDEEETISPEEAKLEAHTMLNQLVADEIEAINGYEVSKEELLGTPLEHKEEIIHTIDHIKDEEKEHIDELINATKKIPFEKLAVEELEEDNTFDQDFPEAEELEEASSAEKKAFKDGGDAYADYIQGKAIARIKDKDMRDAAIALAKANASKDALDRFTGDRKIDQAERDFEKKQFAMANAGMTEDLHKNEEALVAEWAKEDFENGAVFSEDDYDLFARLAKEDGIEPTEKLFKHYFNCVDDLLAKTDESLEFTVPQDLEDNRTPAPAEEAELGEPVDGDQVRKHEHAIEEDTDVNYIEYIHSYCNALEPHLDELKEIEDIEELKKAILDIVEKDPDVNDTEKKNKFIYIIKNKKWGSAKSIIKYLENAMKKAKDIEVKVDDEGELIKEDFEEETEICAWCGDEYPKSELHKEVDLGYLCDGCERAIKSRGEKLVFEEDLVEEENKALDDFAKNLDDVPKAETPKEDDWDEIVKKVENSPMQKQEPLTLEEEKELNDIVAKW